MTGLYGGAFDPPHLGHLALAQAAIERFGLERLVVLVEAAPGHKAVDTDVSIRLRLARAGFAGVPQAEVVQNEHARTVDLLRDGRYDGALLLIGADQLAAFWTWKEPLEVLRHVRLAVATRPGVDRRDLDPTLALLPRDRVELFPIEAVPLSSTDLRARAARGEPLDPFVPPAVAELLRELRPYRQD